MTKAEVRGVLVNHIGTQLLAQGRDISSEQLDDDSDLLLSGLIDSLGLLELTAALDEYCGFELDYDTLEPEQMTIVGPLCDFVVAQASSRQ